MDFGTLKDLVFDWQKKRGVGAVEIYFFHEKGLKIGKKDRSLETFKPYEEKALALRLLHHGALGFAYTAALEPESILAAAEKALEMALIMPKENVSFPEPEDYPGLTPVKRPLLPPEEALNSLEIMEEKALATDPRVKRIQEVALHDQEGTLYLANSNGLDVSWPYRATSLVALVIAQEGEEAQMGWEWKAELKPEDLSPEEIAETAAKRASCRLGAKTIPSQKTQVLLPPHIAVDFLELLSAALCGDNVLKGKSMLAGKINQKVFSPLVNIFDDGLLVGALGTRPFDDEGVAQRETSLVLEGVLQGFLFDRYWGQKAGQGSTGNARRANFKNPPSVGLTNFYLAPGKSTPKELLSPPKVFEVIEVLGMHTADPVSGDFSLGVGGILHQNGNTTPVAQMALSGNIFSLFQNIEALGEDLTFYGNLGSPSILTGELDLAGCG